ARSAEPGIHNLERFREYPSVQYGMCCGYGFRAHAFGVPRNDATMAIRITDDISIGESEIEESFVRSSGPGGQNVNKLSTAVQIRFDVRRSPSLPNDVAVRLMRLAGKRLTKDGVLRSEEHTSELQSRGHLVCRLLLEKKKRKPCRSWRR